MMDVTKAIIGFALFMSFVVAMVFVQGCKKIDCDEEPKTVVVTQLTPEQTIRDLRITIDLAKDIITTLRDENTQLRIDVEILTSDNIKLAEALRLEKNPYDY